MIWRMTCHKEADILRHVAKTCCYTNNSVVPSHHALFFMSAFLYTFLGWSFCHTWIGLFLHMYSYLCSSFCSSNHSCLCPCLLCHSAIVPCNSALALSRPANAPVSCGLYTHPTPVRLVRYCRSIGNNASLTAVLPLPLYVTKPAAVLRTDLPFRHRCRFAVRL